MAENDNDQKTEQATERHLNEAAERGQIAKSPELMVLLMLAATVGVLGFTGKTSAEAVAEYSIGLFTRFTTIHLGMDTITSELSSLLLVLARVLLPVLVASVGAT